MLPVRRNQNWLPSIFNDIFDDDFATFTPSKQFASPAVNILENEKNYEIEVAAPGMKKGDFKINVENDNELVISLEKKHETEEKKNYLRREFSYSSFRQSYILPDEVSVEGISAAMVDGVLKITLPKKEETVKAPASRQIEIC